MIFNSFEYLLFFSITFILYYIVKDKYRYLVLLVASYFFYGFSDVKNILILLFITLVSYFSGKLISHQKKEKTKKIILIAAISLCIGTLLYFKYSSFILGEINNLISTSFVIENIVVPLGISFFILQAITYPIDIYRKDVKEEKNIFKFALFISFFPQILSGPIGKSKELLPQFNKEHKFEYSENIKSNDIIEITEKNKIYLDKIINLSKENNIKLIFVKTPANYTEEDYKKLNYINKIADENKVVFLNYIENINDLNLDYSKDFYDSGHLNKNGSEKFSNKFSETVKELNNN